jgi:tetrahydromethanopterin S-methyltransferase subunit G
MHGAARAGAAEDIEVMPRVDRDPSDFTETHSRRELEKVHARLERDLGDLLSG